MSAIPQPLPLQAVYSWEPALAQQVLRTMLQADPPFDVLHVEHLRGARYGLWIAEQLRRQGQLVPVVWDSVDCISHLFQQASQHSKSGLSRLVSRLELGRTQRYEPWLVEQFDRTLVTSDLDRRALLDLADDERRMTNDERRIAGNGHPSSVARRPSSVARRPSSDYRIRTLPNGVDLDYFRPMPIERDRETIILTGKMSYHATITAARFLIDEIMPRVWQELPNVRVEIVGSHPTREVMALANRHSERVNVTGHVPDLRIHLARATLSVAPVVYGAGIQNKVLEAMAMATPVVATPQAVAALAVRDGDNVSVGRDAPQFAGHVVSLFRNRLARVKQGDCGREYVETEHDWKCAAERLEDIYGEVTPGRRAKVQGGMPIL